MALLLALLLTLAPPYRVTLPLVAAGPVAVLVLATPPGAVWLAGEREALREQALGALAFWERWGPDHPRVPLVAVYAVAVDAAPRWGNSGLTWADAYVGPGITVLAVVQTRGAPGWFFTNAAGYCDRRQRIAYIVAEDRVIWRAGGWAAGAWAHELGHCWYGLEHPGDTGCDDADGDILSYPQEAWEHQSPGRCTLAALGRVGWRGQIDALHVAWLSDIDQRGAHVGEAREERDGDRRIAGKDRPVLAVLADLDDAL